MTPEKIIENAGLTDFEILEYIQGWEKSESFCDIGYLCRNGHFYEAIDTILSTGAIDSNQCYEYAKNIERVIEQLGPFASKMADYKEAFEGSICVTCECCNNVQVLESENFHIYENELKKGCWECSSKNITLEKLENGDYKTLNEAV